MIHDASFFSVEEGEIDDSNIFLDVKDDDRVHANGMLSDFRHVEETPTSRLHYGNRESGMVREVQTTEDSLDSSSNMNMATPVGKPVEESKETPKPSSSLLSTAFAATMVLVCSPTDSRTLPAQYLVCFPLLGRHLPQRHPLNLFPKRRIIRKLLSSPCNRPPSWLKKRPPTESARLPLK